MATKNQIVRMVSLMVLCGVASSIIAEAERSALTNVKVKGTKRTKLALTELDAAFEQFKAVYPVRDGADPSHPAKLKFIAAINSGEKPEIIIAGAQRLADEWKVRLSRKPGDARFIPRSSTWLNEKRWQAKQGQPQGGETMFDIANHFENRVKATDNEQRSGDDGHRLID